MKIVVVTKTLNEARNIENFCGCYSWADRVLVADGGSIDATVELAEQFGNVEVRDFPHRVAVAGDPNVIMNPEPQHLNFVIDWAIEDGADWIILDGADCFPNPALQAAARGLLEGTELAAVHLHRLYIWGTDQYFPKMNVSHALWAWRPALIRIRAEESADTSFDAPMLGIDPDRALLLDPPLVCLHFSWPDEEEVARKMARYKAWGHPQVHPLKSIYAPPVPLPDWAKK